MRRTRLLAVVTPLLVVVAACGGSEGDGSDPAGGTGEATTFTATAAPTEHPDGVGARADLTELSCEHEEGVWTLRGLLVNPGEQPAEYVVNASIAQLDGGNVAGGTRIEERLEPGEERPIEAVAFHEGDTDGTRCTVSVHRL